jgi:hypothetical protein
VRFIQTRQLHPDDSQIPLDIHIAGEGEAVRILGGFVGNGVDAFGVWTPVLEKIDSDYERWARLNLTLTMKKNIDQIIAGSRSQYLAQVNVMPPAVRKHILKAQKDFINDSKSSMIARDSLRAPRDQGGIGLFNLEARNEALLLLKAASLAESDVEKHSHWASLALHQLSKHIVKSPAVAEEARTNLMVQNVKVNQRDPPAIHKAMVKCLNKYGLSFETVHPSTELQRSMPLWHHPGEDPQKRQVNNGQKAKCLRGKHVALTIGAGVDLAQRLDGPLHYRSASCVCDTCEDDRTTRGCENPHACAIAAASRLGQILPRWIPIPGGNEVPGPAATPPEEETNSKLFTPPESIMVLTQGLRAMTRRQNEPIEQLDPPVRSRAVVIPTLATTIVYIARATHAPPT